MSVPRASAALERLREANNSAGIAIINWNVSGSGIYTIRVVNVSVGSVKVWTAATPYVRR